MTDESGHDAATCPAFGGCADCRSAKFEAASPDVVIPAALTDSQILSTREMAEGDHWLASLRADLRGPAPEADPVDYADVPAFNAAADATLARCQAVHTQRGNTYGDSWALDNMVTTYLDSVLRTLGIFGLSKAEKRLLESASLVDVKDARMGGDWKLDNVDDGINFRAAFASWRTEYKEATGQ